MTILVFVSLTIATAIYGPRLYDWLCLAAKRRRGRKAMERINAKYRSARR